MQITKDEARELVETYKGDKFFRVTFIKRTNGQKRLMVCRKNVKKHLKGGQPAYDFKSKGLVCVFDVQAMGYRTIALESIISVKIDGKEEYTVI